MALGDPVASSGVTAQPKTEIILEIENLAIRRGRATILEDFNWRVQRGENWVVLGPNGCGKTSLLSALLGYLTPSAGRLSLFGKDYGRTDWRAMRPLVGIVSSSIRQMMADSEPALYSVASGRDAVIDYWGTPRRADLAKARTILSQVECGHLSQRPWAVLSQGERQRILIGRSLMAAPRLLILDEPCAGLDPAARERFLAFLERLAAKPSAPTLVFVTHHVEEIMPLFTHVLLIRGGKKLSDGPIRQNLNSASLSETFGCAARLRRTAGRFQLAVQLGMDEAIA